MSDTDATRARQDVVADVDEILEHVINANMLSMPYDVYSELFDAVDGLGVKVEKLQAENAKLRELLLDTLMHPREYCEKHGIEYAGWDSANAHVDARLRDLGIEVAE